MWLTTASPTSTDDASGADTLPTVVHDTPSLEVAAVNVLPVRDSRSHPGDTWLPLATNDVLPFGVVRVMNSSVPLGRVSSSTWREPALKSSRNMKTPPRYVSA